MTRRALVSGASIAGLASAFWLSRTGWEVQVVERADAFRDGGQNVDVRGVAREVADRMGITAAIRDRTTTEQGTRFVGRDGRTIGEFPAEAGVDGPTAELEILRGDLARTILEALPDGVDIVYGDAIERIDDTEGSARVRLTSGTEVEVDLVVVAEGVRSRTRSLVFGDAAELDRLGLAIVYGTIERTDADDDWWRWYVATGERHVTLRPDAVGTIRATLAYRCERDEVTGVEREARESLLDGIFADAGWEARRVLDGLATSSDVYADDLAQVRMPAWSAGRVCVVGDAAWCVTPLAGGGSSLALIGPYVLAASLQDADVDAGLAAFESWMRPLVEETQDLPPGVPGIAYPTSRLGVSALRAGIRVAASAPVRRIAAKAFGGAATDERPLPSIRTDG